jgi:hypothetical protein
LASASPRQQDADRTLQNLTASSDEAIDVEASSSPVFSQINGRTFAYKNGKVYETVVDQVAQTIRISDLSRANLSVTFDLKQVLASVQPEIDPMLSKQINDADQYKWMSDAFNEKMTRFDRSKAILEQDKFQCIQECESDCDFIAESAAIGCGAVGLVLSPVFTPAGGAGYAFGCALAAFATKYSCRRMCPGRC